MQCDFRNEFYTRDKKAKNLRVHQNLASLRQSLPKVLLSLAFV